MTGRPAEIRPAATSDQGNGTALSGNTDSADGNESSSVKIKERMYPMKTQEQKYLSLAGSLTFILAFCAFGSMSQGWAQEKGSFLADRHQTKGMQCSSCHKENPPKEIVPSAVCQQCHGNAEKLAEKTMTKTPNPHESHLGDLKCEACHHGHKVAENTCAKCHDFTMHVP